MSKYKATLSLVLEAESKEEAEKEFMRASAPLVTRYPYPHIIDAEKVPDGYDLIAVHVGKSPESSSWMAGCTNAKFLYVNYNADDERTQPFIDSLKADYEVMGGGSGPGYWASCDFILPADADLDGAMEALKLRAAKAGLSDHVMVYSAAIRPPDTRLASDSGKPYDANETLKENELIGVLPGEDDLPSFMESKSFWVLVGQLTPIPENDEP